MHSKTTSIARFACLLFALATTALRAQEEGKDNFDRSYDQGASFTIIEENDLFVKTDHHYTQGLRISYLSPDNRIPEAPGADATWIERMGRNHMVWGFDPKSYRLGYEVGQNIYTPSDISISTLVPNERPYAGWLYFGLNMQRRGETLKNRTPTMENLSLLVGVIGPWSLAKEAQIWVHELRGFALPQGWHYQLKNEPAINLRYQRFWVYRYGPREKFNIDIIPDVALSVGNPLTAAQIGSTVRLGWNLPDDFGIQHGDSLSIVAGGPSPSHKSHWGFYVYGSAAGRAVGFNEFLDGNIFYNSHSVHKEPFVADLIGGAVATSKYMECGFSLIYRTPEFHGQLQHDAFGSVYLRFKWQK